jgi:hypothetical protein
MKNIVTLLCSMAVVVSMMAEKKKDIHVDVDSGSTKVFRMEASGGVKEIGVGGDDIRVVSNADWLSVISSGDGSLKLVANPNDQRERVSSLTVYYKESLPLVITVFQDASGYVESAREEIKIAPEGDTDTLTVISNDKWEVENESSWLTVHTKSDQGAGNIAVSAEKNNSNEKRVARLRLLPAGTVITVTQEAIPAVDLAQQH